MDAIRKVEGDAGMAECARGGTRCKGTVGGAGTAPRFARFTCAALGVAGVVVATLPTPALAQAGATPRSAGDYPTRPIRIVVGFTPGGQPDIFSRLISPRLTDTLGQQVLVDNRPGAGGAIGAKIVAEALPDGHTLLAVSAAHAIQPAVARLGYDTLRDFAGVTKMFSSAYLLVVPATPPFASVRDLLALARAKPGQVNFGSAGTGSGTHFAGEMFKDAARIDVVHVPYKGVPEALTDTIANRVQFFMAPLSSAMTLVKEGRLRALAVSTAKRASAVPDIPTVAEAAIPGFEFDSWGGLLAPAKTPRPVIRRLNAEVVAALALPDIQSRMRALGAEPDTGTPEAFDAFVAQQVGLIAALAARAGLAPGR
jgi:tripartite-type tricarboxylate transporter receptor subunit TctC